MLGQEYYSAEDEAVVAEVVEVELLLMVENNFPEPRMLVALDH